MKNKELIEKLQAIELQHPDLDILIPGVEDGEFFDMETVKFVQPMCHFPIPANEVKESDYLAIMLDV